MCNPVTAHHPDVLLAKGEHAGLEWEVVKNAFGYRCGYVRIPAGHPWHGKGYYDVEPAPDVHGGLTFAAADTDCGKGDEGNAWWLGFDCAHTGDAKDPRIMTGEQIAGELAMERRYSQLSGSTGTVKTTEYVTGECHRLAEQAQAAAAP